MAYPSFETTEGEVISQAEANSRYLTNAGTFDAYTSPTLTKVEMFAANAYYYVVGQLYANGYGTAPANAAVQNILAQIQALDTTVQVEQSMPTDENGKPNTRHKGFIERRDRMIETFLTQRALEGVGQPNGADKDRSSLLELTGRSKSRAETAYSDSDVFQPRFPRGFHDKKVAEESADE